MDNRTSSTLEGKTSGLYTFIAGVIVLVAGSLILWVTTFLGLHPLLGILWTYWIFLAGLIGVARGLHRWIHSAIKASATENNTINSGVATMRASDRLGKR